MNAVGPLANASTWKLPTVIALVLANLVPLYGVLFLGWETFPLVFLFWLENVIVGAFNVLKMLMAPAYGRMLLKRPLTVFSVLKDSEDLIGFSTRFTKDKKTISLMFENDELAREFIALNPQENE